MTTQKTSAIRLWLTLFALLGAALFSLQPAAASAPLPQQPATGYIEISGAPLRILAAPNLSLQVFHEKYLRGAAFGDAGSGFFVAIDQNVFGPFNRSTESIRHEGPTGGGTSGSPFQVISEVQVASDETSLNVVQTISYINGRNYFQLDWRITNDSQERVCFKAYHAADLYFADDDYGTGYYNDRTGSVGGSNRDGDWFMVFTPRYPADHYEEAHYATIWSRVGSASDLQDAIEETYLDNGAALQWDICLNAGQAVTVGDLWSFGESEAEAIQPAALGSYRAAGPLTPALTTYIPTPLDISLAPAVVGSNMLLAALAMILFTASSELLNRTLAENEPFFQKLLIPIRWLRDRAQALGAAVGRYRWLDWPKLILIALAYGLIFSLLDASWNPFSLSGLVLFTSMTFAFGMVGLADDLAQWLAARRWKVPSRLGVRPGNLLLAVASAAISRVFGLVPGIMFGSPEAFDIEDAATATRTRNSLLRIAALTLIVLALVFWLPTILTALLQRAGLPGFILALLGWVESFMLVVFAVTVQNIFLQMLAFPGSFGEGLRRWNLFAWAGGLFAAAYLLLQTLLNPNGDVGRALASTNIRLFLITIGLFAIGSFGVWLAFKLYKRAQVWEMERKIAALPGPDGKPVAASGLKSIPVWVLFAGGAVLMLCLCSGVVAVVLLVRQLGGG